LAVLVVFAPLVAFLIRSKPADIGLRPYGEESDVILEEKPAHSASDAKTGSHSVWAVLRQRIFWQLSIPYFICGFSDVGLINTHYIPFTQGNGFSTGIIAFTFSLIAITNIIGTIGTGYLADRWNRSRLLALIYMVRALTFVFLLIADKPWLLMIFALIYGISEMASIAPTSSICADLFGKYSFGVVLGVISISHMLGGSIGSMIPGIIYDSVHSYVPVFIISAILLALGSVIVLGVPDDRGVKKGSAS
jgi:MFS family permease